MNSAHYAFGYVAAARIPRRQKQKRRRAAPPTINLYPARGLAASLFAIIRIAALRSGGTHEAATTMHDDEWTPVSLEKCSSVPGPFYHGTKAELSTGDLLTAGFRSNYDDRVVMNHIYFTTMQKGAGLAAELAKGNGRPRVYLVMPTGAFEDDPNVTNKKFRGNPTRSYRSEHALEILAELESWESHDPEFIQQLRSRVGTGMGEIIN